jgi:hypothetical protein
MKIDFLKGDVIMPFLIILLIVVVAVGAYAKTPSGKGVIGELIVRINIGKTKPGKQYVVNNILFQTDDGKSSQVDHVLINPNGVFVVETKNYAGRIYGNEKQHEWTQVFNYGRSKFHFYNPVKQNATHIYRLREALGNNVYMKSLIVFVQNNTAYIESDKVCTIREMKYAIKEPQSKQLSVNDMEIIYNQLLDLKNGKSVSKKEHVKNINTMLDGVDKNICPRCGGKLVERNGNNGTFYGCSNYPKCKFIKK